MHDHIQYACLPTDRPTHTYGRTGTYATTCTYMYSIVYTHSHGASEPLGSI